MTKYYMMKVSREGVQLYGGRQEDNGSYTVFEDRNLKTVEEFCDINVPDSDKAESVIGIIFSASYKEAEKRSIMGKLSQHGYPHLKEYDFNSYLCEIYKTFPHALILSADGNDLYVG